MIYEEICTYEVCKLAKEKGVQLDCIGYYDFAGEFYFNYESAISNKERTFCHNKYNNIWHRDLTDAPTQSLLQRWLREEKGVCISVEAYPTLAIVEKIYFAWVVKSGSDGHFMESNDSLQTFSTYELALEDALKYALENLI